MYFPLSLHPGLFIPRLAVCWLFAVCSDTRQPINRLSTEQSTPTRGNVQPVVRTWSSPIPSPAHSSSSPPSYLDCEVYKCKQRDCRVPELTQTHHDANRMGGGGGEEGKEKLSSNGHKVAVCQASLWDSPYLPWPLASILTGPDDHVVAAPPWKQ